MITRLNITFCREKGFGTHLEPRGLPFRASLDDESQHFLRRQRILLDLCNASIEESQHTVDIFHEVSERGMFAELSYVVVLVEQHIHKARIVLPMAEVRLLAAKSRTGRKGQPAAAWSE